MVTLTFPAFQPAAWLPNAHFQTVFASLVMPVPLPEYRREIIELPDGDIIAADWIDGAEGAPLLVLVHGMEGDSSSNYARLFMNACRDQGWSGVVLHMRSCGGLINRKKTFYHAGYYTDIMFFLNWHLVERSHYDRIYLVGISLGGSQIAHYLGKAVPTLALRAAAMVSAPLDLRASADFMQTGFNRLYVLKFRSSLLKKYHQKANLIQDEQMVARLAVARSFWELDEVATAPLHGFRDASEYYEQMSAKNCLQDIVVPTLYLASRDDPFIPAASQPPTGTKIGEVTAYLTTHGGHVGFVNHYGNSWMVPAVMGYFARFED